MGATNRVYCNIYSSASGVSNATAQVTAEIDRFMDSDQVKTWNDHSDKVKLLHALPYVLMIAMFFFACFWKRDAACCCCGGSKVGCLLLIPYALLWLVFFILSLVVVAVGWTVRNKSDEIKLGSVFNGDPSLKELSNIFRRL